MIRIVESPIGARSSALLVAGADARRGHRARVSPRSSPTCAATATRRCVATRASSIGLDGPIEVSRDGDARGRARRSPHRARGDSHRRPATSAPSPSARCRAAGARAVAPGHHRRAARRPARSRRLLRAGRPLSPALVAADDGDSRRRPPASARSSPSARGPSRWSWRRRSRPASRACSASAARTPSPRWPTAPPRCRASTRSSGPATATWPRPRRWSPPTAASTSTPARPRSSSSPRAARADWIAADLIAQAEHDPDARAVLITPSRTLAEQVAARRSRAQMPADGPGARSRCAHTAASSSPTSLDEAMDLANAAAPEHLVVDDDADGGAGAMRRLAVRRAVVGAGRRRLRDRLEPRAADRRRRARPRRAVGGRLRAADHRAAR